MDGLVVNRPLLALGLVAASVLLLSSLFADVRQEIEDPTQWQPDPDLVEAGAKAAAKAGGQGGATGGSADLLRLLGGGQITLPEGTQIDGDLIRLLEGVEWTLPAGTELEDLSLPLPAGIGVDLPAGTTIDGESLVFPPGSTLTLHDGTILELPEGGRLTLPGMSNSELRQALRDGHVVTTEGSVFTAPRVVSDQEWPLVLPPGTEFKLPEGWTPPDDWEMNGNRLAEDFDWTIPAGTEAAPQGFDAESQDAQSGSSLFDRIGDINLDNPASRTPAVGGLPALGDAGWLVWVLIGAAVLVGAFLLWRFRHKLLPPRDAAAAAAGRAPRSPLRALIALDDRPAGLPLAAAPGDAPRVTLRLEAETFETLPPESPDGKPRRVRRFAPTAGRIVAWLGDERVADIQVPTDGASFTLPALHNGDHALRLEAYVSSQRRAVPLDHVLRVAPWAEQVARDYQSLYETAGRALSLPDGFTPRTLEKALQARLGRTDSRRIDQTITIFERANYSQSDVDRADWLRFVVAAQAYTRLIETRRGDPREPTPPAAPTA